MSKTKVINSIYWQFNCNLLTGKKIPPPENVRDKTYETLNITLNSLSIVLQELIKAYQADLKRARVGGWSDRDNKANLSSTKLKLDLRTGTELGNNGFFFTPKCTNETSGDKNKQI